MKSKTEEKFEIFLKARKRFELDSNKINAINSMKAHAAYLELINKK